MPDAHKGHELLGWEFFDLQVGKSCMLLLEKMFSLRVIGRR